MITPFKAKCDKAWERIFQQSAKANFLYHCLAVLGGIDMEEEFLHIRQLNKFTQEWLFNSTNQSGAAEINGPTLAFLLQQHYESKPFYSAIKRVTSVPTGNYFHPNPWRRNELYKPDSEGPARIKTSAVISNISQELAQLGEAELGSDFLELHRDFAAPVRHSIAHGTFLIPDEPEGVWRFSDYVKKPPPNISLLITEYPFAEFSEKCLRFFNVRLAFLNAFSQEENRLRSIEGIFEAPNQNAPYEILTFELQSGAIRLRYRGNPIW